MDWDKLKVFHAAAEAGSFTHAGEQLGLSQSAVSRQVSALEQELAVSLFHRHARGLMLTEQGSGWVLEWLAIMDAMARDPKFAFHANGPLKMKPSEYFHRQCWLGSSLVHRREIEMRHAIGVGKMMWGWDFPHIESADWLAPQDSIRAVMAGVPEAELRAIVAGNAAAAYDLDLARLRPLADRIGPRLADLVSA